MPTDNLANRIYASILQLIVERDLREGSRLPSELRMAELFGVSRTVIREALVRLAADEIVISRRGAGSYVKRRPAEHLSAYLPDAKLSEHLGTYEVRFVLEAEAARLAAIRRSDRDLATIEAAMAALGAALLSDQPAHDEDWALHRAIMIATQTPAFLLVFDRMAEEIGLIMKAGVLISRARSASDVEAMMTEHEHIVEAIRWRDAEGAALAMRWHLTQGRKRLMR
ncbi:GntR family transcriptional regulator [Sphingomonas oleivorans]|uniref:GntR family transcriptional regulator n=1 Tax=Sphingomonas oleivorans TaxID=1735121 RepID=A0A2T5FVG4_9SPHN|nr:FCD domain-containing protein [Sphingomonas oleivorans]PTQ09443.1 GntR family transcriptional regulator [Sphingomonas oleivorans]